MVLISSGSARKGKWLEEGSLPGLLCFILETSTSSQSLRCIVPLRVAVIGKLGALNFEAEM